MFVLMCYIESSLFQVFNRLFHGSDLPCKTLTSQLDDTVAPLRSKKASSAFPGLTVSILLTAGRDAA